jgi:hypothetical protein
LFCRRTIYTSSNGGVAWSLTSGAGNHPSSNSGSTLVAVADGGYVSTSVNGGSTWTTETRSDDSLRLSISGNGKKVFLGGWSSVPAYETLS